MKHLKRILGIFLSALLVFGVAIPTAYAAPGSNVNIVGVGGDTGVFEVFYSGAWHPLNVPYWRIQDQFALAFCLESDATAPTNDGYNIAVAMYNTATVNGLKAILLHGAPNDTGGLQTGQAWYATQVAIWVWMREQAGVGKPFYTQSTVRAAAGEQAVYNFYQYLLDKARNNVQSLSFGISANPSTVTLTDNGSGQLVGTTTVNFTNLNGSYTIDQSKIPAGVGVYGNTMLHGDVVTVMAPLSYAGQTVSMTNVLVGRDTRVASNVFWHAPDASGMQNMVVFSYEEQPVTSGSISFTCAEQPKGRMVIDKTVKGGGSPAGFQFEVRNSGGTLVGTYTTDSTGQISIPNLPVDTYSIKEVNIPSGYTVQGDNPKMLPVWANEATGIDFVNIKQQGKITVRKTNSSPGMGDYSLAGAVFEIWNASGSVLCDTITTDASGTATSGDLDLGGYIVREKAAPQGFVRNSSDFPVTLSEGGAEVQATVPNEPQSGRIRLTKTNTNPGMGDYALNGAVFEVRNSGGTVVDTITTDAAGAAQTKALPLGAYTVMEKTAPHGFVRNPDTFPVTLSYVGQDVSVAYGDVAVGERPQTGRITVTKRDSVTGDTAQGDSTLNGAVFEILASDQSTVLDTLYCGTANKAATKELPLGVFYIKEKTPPTGYTLDTTMHKVTIAYGNQDVEVVLVDGEVKNKVIEGQLAIVKHSDQIKTGYDDPQIEQPVKAIFEVYLKASGSYASAKATERDRMETNENGYALSKKLPYGVYTVKEIKAEGDVKLVAPFDVFINEEGKIYRFILNDPAYTARVQVIKLDGGTGKVIPAAGTSFKIKDLKTGKWVEQEVWYPTPAKIDSYETGPDGTLMLPEPLPSGEYELHEVRAPHGYLLSSQPVKFSLSSAQPEAIVPVKMNNTPVMGKISLEKQGEMLTGVNEVDTKWGKQLVPVFSLQPLVGAEFDIIAAEDIVTPDGTVRAKQGDVVDHIVTGADGTATSKALFLGNYLAVETRCPEDFVLDPTPHPVSLVYADQHTAIVTAQIGIGNARQSVEIFLRKVMEKPLNAPEDFNAFADVVFGLFAGESFQSDSVISIPKDALVAVITLDEDGRGVFEGDLPFGKFYVRELQTGQFYRLSDTVYPIDVNYAGPERAVSRAHVNNGGTIPNELKQGKIVVEKQGEVFVGADKAESGYTPVYELRGLPGATFDIIAAEGIYDVFGKLVTAKGTVVDTITTGADGKAESKLLRLARYELVETAVPAGYVLDPQRRAITLDFDGSVEEVVTKSVTVLNERYHAEIRILKLWEMPDNAPKDFAPWKDITFGLYATADILAADGSAAIPAGALIEVISIDEKGGGIAKTDLPAGSYFIKELTTAKGYALDEQRHDVRFDAAGEAVTVISISAENKIERGSLRIIKTFEGRTTPIAGVPFTVVGQTAFGEIRIEAKTDKDGVILLEGLPVGTYTVTELASELTKGYVLSEAQTAKVAAGKIAEMTINNKLQRGALKIIKTFEGREKPIKDVPFLIVGQTAGGEVKLEAKTDKNGEILLKDLPVGEYTVTEQRSDLTAGYVLSPAQTVTVEAGKTAEVKIENKLQKGSLRVIKVFEGRTEPLEGVPFRVAGQTVNGELKLEAKTDKNGEIVLKDLPVGTYVVTELKSDLTKGYVLAPKQTVTITTGSEAILRITNQLAKGEIRVLKLDKETGDPLEGAMFGLYKDGKLIAEAKSGKDGYAVFKDVDFGEYEIKELSAPVGYMRSEDVLKAVVGKDGSVVMFEVTNERIPGEPVEPEEPEVPVGPSEPLPKTGDSKTIVVIALVVLILAGGVALWLRRRGKDEEATEEPAESEELS